MISRICSQSASRVIGRTAEYYRATQSLPPELVLSEYGRWLVAQAPWLFVFERPVAALTFGFSDKRHQRT